MPRRAVIRFQFDDRGIRIILLKTENVANICLSPGVNGLVGITNDKEILESIGERGDQNVLHSIGVLILINQDVLESLLVAFKQGRRRVKKTNRQHKEIVEIDGVRF